MVSFQSFKCHIHHDNDPKHTTKLVKQRLSVPNFDVLTWPPQSYVSNEACVGTCEP